MKNYHRKLSAFLVFVLLVTSCTYPTTPNNFDLPIREDLDVRPFDFAPITTFEVSFVNNLFNTNTIIVVNEEETVNPLVAYNTGGDCFQGWSTDPTVLVLFDFTTPILESFSLYAIYAPFISRKYVTFVFDLVDDTYFTSYFEKGTIPAIPEVPIKPNYTLVGWSKADTGNYFYDLVDLSVPLFQSLYLYAQYEYTNQDPYIYKIQQKVITGVFYIEAVSLTYFENDTGFYYHSRQGNGFLFYETDDDYYLLTKNELLGKIGDHPLIEYRVYDLDNRRYMATLVYSDPSLDLAILKFAKEDRTYPLLKFADRDRVVRDEVISLSVNRFTAPLIDFGFGFHYIYDDRPDYHYTPITTPPTFPLFYHTAITPPHNFGGPLLNLDLEVVGLSYNAIFSFDNVFILGAMMPVSKIKPFISNFHLSMA
jgi:hypothetical protein